MDATRLKSSTVINLDDAVLVVTPESPEVRKEPVDWNTQYAKEGEMIVSWLRKVFCELTIEEIGKQLSRK